MKKALVLAVLALAALGSPAAALTYAGVALNLMPVYTHGSFQSPQIGWLTNDGTGHATLDGLDSSDGANGLTAMPWQMELDIVNTEIATSKVNYDFRAPLTAGSWKIWHLKVYIPEYYTDAYPDQPPFAAPFGLKAWFIPGMGMLSPNELFILDGSYADFSSAYAASQGSARLWTAPHDNGATSYNSSATRFTLPSPVLLDEQNNIWSTPTYDFTVFAYQPVPEPSSILAVLAGLAGFAGFGIRRRR